jgi:hypothetical protein
VSCEPRELVEQRYVALPVEGSDCFGAEREGCWEDAEVIVQQEEIVLRWTDADGQRWEASWAREL